MADIGTDHGFLPVALWEQGICPNVILADVNQGPLDRAKSNAALSHPGVEFDCRLGDGLKVIQPGEVDVIAIAGMGGTLMTEILGEDLEKTWSYKKSTSIVLFLKPFHYICAHSLCTKVLHRFMEKRTKQYRSHTFYIMNLAYFGEWVGK